MTNYEIPRDEYWDFPRERIQLIGKLGEGAFGVVFKAKAEELSKPNTSTIVAIKMLKSLFWFLQTSIRINQDTRVDSPFSTFFFL